MFQHYEPSKKKAETESAPADANHAFSEKRGLSKDDAISARAGIKKIVAPRSVDSRSSRQLQRRTYNTVAAALNHRED